MEPNSDGHGALAPLVAAGVIPKGVMEYCSQGSPESEIRLLTIEELRECTTMCGAVPNTPFLGEVYDYLKAHADPKVLAEVFVPTKESLVSRESALIIANMAVRWRDRFLERTNAFSELVEKHGGSLRCEENNEDMWDCYESE